LIESAPVLHLTTFAIKSGPANLDYAMELQQLQGNACGYNLRNFEVEFFGLDEVGSSDKSKVRVELLTPGQFRFATQLFGVEFRPQMLSATYANTALTAWTAPNNPTSKPS
jgi:hypothetical protein